jgi:hypothetical protein
MSQQHFVGRQGFVNTPRLVAPQVANPQRYVGQPRFVTPPSFVNPRHHARRVYPYIIGGVGIAGAYYYGNGPAYYGSRPYASFGYDEAVAYCVQTYGDAFDIDTMTYLADDGRRYPCPPR